MCRTTNTTAAAVAMKISVAANERSDRRDRPQTPWPEVHPLPSTAPKPTSRPAATSAGNPASMTGAGQDRYHLAHVMSAAWAAFARTGNPDHADMPHWPAFDPATLPTMEFGNNVEVKNDPNKEERLALGA